jgi:hypothetical protein
MPFYTENFQDDISAIRRNVNKIHEEQEVYRRSYTAASAIIQAMNLRRHVPINIGMTGKAACD